VILRAVQRLTPRQPRLGTTRNWRAGPSWPSVEAADAWLPHSDIAPLAGDPPRS
jgi:hypothetical protein